MVVEELSHQRRAEVVEAAVRRFHPWAGAVVEEVVRRRLLQVVGGVEAEAVRRSQLVRVLEVVEAVEVRLMHHHPSVAAEVEEGRRKMRMQWKVLRYGETLVLVAEEELCACW